jgi:hypothetical protein
MNDRIFYILSTIFFIMIHWAYYSSGFYERHAPSMAGADAVHALSHGSSAREANVSPWIM